MQREIRMFTNQGDTVVKTYDPETCDMKEVNAFVDTLEKQVGGKAFSLETGEQIDQITPETKDVFVLRPIAGG
jgi:putative heme degradation protein